MRPMSQTSTPSPRISTPYRVSRANAPGPRRAYSTVTDFARFRGWSTSQPRSFAMW
jgi:hypothetical protein